MNAVLPVVEFYPYQRGWLDDTARFKIGMFARQTGKTWVACAEIVDDCIKAEIAGTRTRWVILSRGERQAKEAIDEVVKPLTKAFYAIYGVLRRPPEFVESEFHGESGATYKAVEVVFPGGSRITALPANPDTARGFSANVLLDEFAFHRDSRAIWKALFPVISKPGLKLRIVSTPNGKGNKFFELMTGKDDGWSRHVCDIYQAVKEGCPRDIEELRAALNDEDAWAQEYELKWLDEASAWLSYELISTVEDDNAGKSKLYTGQPVFIGNDIARRNDLWVAWVLEQVGDVLWTREIVEMRRKKFSEQDAAMDELFLRYKVARLCMDQTGMGEKPVEDAIARYGAYRVEGVLFTGPSKLVMATAGKEAFEDRRIRIPLGDPALRSDLHSLRKTSSATGAPRFVVEDDTTSHADRAWAGFLAIHAASSGEEGRWRPL